MRLLTHSVLLLILITSTAYGKGKNDGAEIKKINDTQDLDFGEVSSDVSGVMNSNLCVGNGNFMQYGSCTNGEIKIEMKNGDKNDDNKIRISKNIDDSKTTENADSSFQIFPLDTTNCHEYFNYIECTNPNNKKKDKHDFFFKVIGSLTTDENNSGSKHNGKYEINACGCKKSDCPTSFPSSGYDCEDGDGKTEVELKKNLTVESIDNLYFGEILPSKNSGGNVVVNQSGTNGGVHAIMNPGNRGKLSIAGEDGKNYNINFSSSSVILGCDSISCGSAFMNANLSFSGTNPRQCCNDDIYINGSLYVNQNQKHGIYKGTYDITVSYD